MACARVAGFCLTSVSSSLEDENLSYGGIEVHAVFWTGDREEWK